MSRKRLLNITSEKKRDNMVPVSATPTGTNATAGGYVVAGGTPTLLIWNATYRQRIAADPNGTMTRSGDTCFIRGLREMISIRTNASGTAGAASWLWRRILFTAKGLYQVLGTSQDYLYTSSGYTRFLANFNGTAFGTTLTELLFQGTYNTDWVDLTTAKTDSSRLTVLYDHVTRLTPQTAGSAYWTYKRWHAINKNLIYNNEENGATETNSGYSTIGKPGCGDVYVVDIFQCATQSANDQLYFSPEATLYWHEK